MPLSFFQLPPVAAIRKLLGCAAITALFNQAGVNRNWSKANSAMQMGLWLHLKQCMPDSFHEMHEAYSTYVVPSKTLDASTVTDNDGYG
jgi:hypothetical protein